MTRNPLVWLACAGVCVSASAQSFVSIVNPANPGEGTWGVGISADGQTVVGHFDDPNAGSAFDPHGPFRWSVSGGFEDLRDPSFPFDNMTVAGTSNSATSIVGRYRPVSGPPALAYRYTDGAGYSVIDTDPNPPAFAAIGISGNGGVVYGSSNDSSVPGTLLTAAYVGASGVIVDLGHLGPAAGANISFATGASNNGSVIVGTSSNETSPTNPFVWTQATGMTRITSYADATADGVSRDGQWVIGSVYEGVLARAYRWSDGTGEELLGNIPGLGSHESNASAISDDGSVIVGEARTGAFSGIPWEAFIWTKTMGMMNLRTMLEDQHGLDLAGWQLIEAEDVSADGLAITGRAIDPNGTYRAFYATIPAPGSALVLGVLPVALRRRRAV